MAVDGREAAKQHRLRIGERVEIRAPAPPPAPGPVPDVPPIRYADEHLMVVAKPAGLVVHPGAGTPDGASSYPQSATSARSRGPLPGTRAPSSTTPRPPTSSMPSARAIASRSLGSMRLRRNDEREVSE